MVNGDMGDRSVLLDAPYRRAPVGSSKASGKLEPANCRTGQIIAEVARGALMGLIENAAPTPN